MLKFITDICRQSRLLASELFNERTFYDSFPRDLLRARKSIVIESPYLTERRARYYAPLFRDLAKRKVRIRINTRRPSHHNYGMERRAKKAALILLEAGAKVYIYDDLRHWKLAVIDNKILWEGSLNIMSHGRSREIMRRLRSAHLCRRMVDFAGIYL